MKIIALTKVESIDRSCESGKLKGKKANDGS